MKKQLWQPSCRGDNWANDASDDVHGKAADEKEK